MLVQGVLGWVASQGGDWGARTIESSSVCNQLPCAPGCGNRKQCGSGGGRSVVLLWLCICCWESGTCTLCRCSFASLPCSRNELLGELEIDLMAEVQSAPGGDVTKTWHLQNLATDWMAAMGLQSESGQGLRGFVWCRV